VCAERKATVWAKVPETGPLFLCDACADEVADESVAEFGLPPSPELREATLAFVRAQREVTFWHLGRFLTQRGVPIDGHYDIPHPDDPSQLLWLGMSAAMVGLVIDLLNAGDLVPRRTSLTTYLNHGGGLDLPVAWPTSGVASGEFNQVWLPVVLQLPRRRPGRRRHSGSK
jgi:hypothetical protein